MKMWWMALALVVVPAAATAQTAMGLRAGSRWAQLESTGNVESVNALTIAGYFGFGLSNRVGIQIEAIYGTRGGDEIRIGDGALDPEADPARLEMKYLEVPLLIRAGIPGERLLPTVFIGPYAGFLLDCELTPSGGDGLPCDEADAASRFSPRSTDFGIVAGAGLDVALGENTVFIDARYTLGLLSIESGDNAMDVRHRGFALSGGVAFPLGR